jgi:HK97 family phage portal protein
VAKERKEKRSFLSKLFSKTKKTDNNITLANTFKGFQANYVNYNNSILESDLILSATRLKARFFGKLMPRHVIDNTNQMITVNDSSVARLLRKPNEYQTTFDFLSQAYFQRELHDNCYIYPQYYISNAGEKIYEAMYILLPQQKPFIFEDDSGKLFIKFIFPTYDEPVIFELKDIIIWANNFEDNQFMGGGRYTSAAKADALTSLNTYNSIKESTATVAEQGGTFDGILKVNSYAADDEKIKAIRDKFVADLKSNNGGIATLDNGSDYVDISRQLKTIDATTMAEIKQNLLIHTGVSLEMLEGKFDTKLKEALYENWIEPAAISLGQAMSKCFFSQWQTTHGDQILLYPNKVQLMATSEIVSIIQSTISAGVFKIDEYREMLGYAPLENAEGQVRPRGYNNLDGNLVNKSNDIGGANNE